MFSLPWIFILNNYISYFFIRPPPFVLVFSFQVSNTRFLGGSLWTNISILTERWSLSEVLLTIQLQVTLPISKLTLNSWRTWFINLRRMSPRMKCVSLSNGFRVPAHFQIAPLMQSFLSCAFLPCMFFTNHGTIHSFLCEDLIPIRG